MATDNFDGIFSLPAAADYTAVNYPRLVAVNTSGQYALCAAGAVPDGIGDNFPVAAGEQLRGFLFHGVVKRLEVGTGGVTRGARVSSDAAGKVVISATSGHAYIGKALEAGAAGEVIQVLYMPNGLGAVA